MSRQTLTLVRRAALVASLAALLGAAVGWAQLGGAQAAEPAPPPARQAPAPSRKPAPKPAPLPKPVPLPAAPAPAPVDALAVQQRLEQLTYLPPGAATGAWDVRTTQAVRAFQGMHGLARDGIVGPQTLAALESAVRPQPGSSGAERRIEVHRGAGVVLLVDGGIVVRTVHASAGAPGYETPAGSYTVFRKEAMSWSVPYEVWLPYASYFNGGIALHAYDDVPAYPASHGCVRLSAPEAPFVYEFAALGMPVVVY